MYEKIGSPQASTFSKIIKVVNFLVAGLIIAFGIVGLIFMFIHDIISEKFFLIFSPLFIILFGFVMIGVELKIQFVLSSFEFLRSLLGKGIFYIYISTSVFFFFTCGYNEVALAWICAMIIFALGILYICLNFCCSSDYGDQVRENLN